MGQECISWGEGGGQASGFCARWWGTFLPFFHPEGSRRLRGQLPPLACGQPFLSLEQVETFEGIKLGLPESPFWLAALAARTQAGHRGV